VRSCGLLPLDLGLDRGRETLDHLSDVVIGDVGRPHSPRLPNAVDLDVANPGNDSGI
jgi:hypothetical protein